MIKVYLDICVYNRPFDDQTNEHIFIEARAFSVVIKWIEEGKVTSINSDALEYENHLTSNIDRRLRVRTFLSLATDYVQFSGPLLERANVLLEFGFRAIDALHIVMAEEGGADFFVTCDNSIAKIARKVQNKLKVRVVSLLEFLVEVMKNVEND
jgi:predicted nucleic acid-binding protein